MGLQERQDELVQSFAKFPVWEDKYKALIDYGKSMAVLADEYKVEDLKVKGCQSQVWLKADFKEGLIYFQGDSDALIVKGLLALVLKVYSEASPEDILKTQPEFLTQIGLESHLSPSRANGLFSMIKQIKFYAMAFLHKKNNYSP